MGLDMYIYKTTSLNDPNDGYANVPLDEIIYWRKAYTVHRWFVDNLQEGKDNDAYYIISEDKLREFKNYYKRLDVNNYDYDENIFKSILYLLECNDWDNEFLYYCSSK